MKKYLLLLLLSTLVLACNNNSLSAVSPAASEQAAVIKDSAFSNVDSLPAPFATQSVKNFSKVIGWPPGQMPIAPSGFTVSKFADSLDNPRWIYQAPNGDIFVAEANTVLTGLKKLGAKIAPKIRTEHPGTSANRIILFRNGKRYVYAENLNRPFGMLVLHTHFYIANTDGLQLFDYNPADTLIKGPGKAILALPQGGYNNHWTRNIIPSPDGKKIYVSVGSGSNAGEHGPENEIRRANILEINPDGTGERIYASGLRNPVGMGFQKASGVLWAAVNERDELGDNLVPDYITGVKEGGFYGWPYSYFGAHPDPRRKDDPRPDLVAKAIVPDLALGPHTASLGLAFYEGNAFPVRYQHGVFIGQHGSWNRSALVGYKVIFIPFSNGRPSGKPEDFLTGFIANEKKSEVYGRPVGVTILSDGSLLVADDASGTIWQVRKK